MNRRKKGITFAAACILLILSVRENTVYGAVGIDTDRTDCSIIFDLNAKYRSGTDAEDRMSEGGQEVSLAADGGGYTDLLACPVQIDLYRIASVDVGGRYSVRDTYRSLKDDLSSVNSATAAQQWEELAETAWEIAVSDEQGDVPVVSGFEFYAGTGEDARMVTGLETGLYLVSVHRIMTAEYAYDFMPCLVSLPGSSYTPGGDTDDWLYTVTVGLKPGQENRYGDLEIIKTLDSYNATLGGASFVFQVEAEKDGNVYSDVVSAVFDRAGTKSVKIEGKIPAGAEVTVTEVYSGASYQAVSDPVQTQTILADQSVSVSFANTYDERLNTGTSVVNHFYRKDTDTSRETDVGGAGVWDWMQMRDSITETGGQ